MTLVIYIDDRLVHAHWCNTSLSTTLVTKHL